MLADQGNATPFMVNTWDCIDRLSGVMFAYAESEKPIGKEGKRYDALSFGEKSYVPVSSRPRGRRGKKIGSCGYLWRYLITLLRPWNAGALGLLLKLARRATEKLISARVHCWMCRSWPMVCRNSPWYDVSKDWSSLSEIAFVVPNVH